MRDQIRFPIPELLGFLLWFHTTILTTSPPPQKWYTYFGLTSYSVTSHRKPILPQITRHLFKMSHNSQPCDEWMENIKANQSRQGQRSMIHDTQHWRHDDINVNVARLISFLGCDISCVDKNSDGWLILPIAIDLV